MAHEGDRGASVSPTRLVAAVGGVVLLGAVVVVGLRGAVLGSEAPEQPSTSPSAATPTAEPVDASVLDDLVVAGATDTSRDANARVATVTYAVERDAEELGDELRAVLGDDWLLRSRDTVGTESRAVYERSDGTVLTVQLAQEGAVARVAAIVTAP